MCLQSVGGFSAPNPHNYTVDSLRAQPCFSLSLHPPDLGLNALFQGPNLYLELNYTERCTPRTHGLYDKQWAVGPSGRISDPYLRDEGQKGLGHQTACNWTERERQLCKQEALCSTSGHFMPGVLSSVDSDSETTAQHSALLANGTQDERAKLLSCGAAGKGSAGLRV